MTLPKIFLPISFALLITIGCFPEFEDNNPELNSPLNSKSYLEVDSQLWEYFELFEVEAASRGYSINLINLEITGAIERISEDGVAGTCQYGNHIHHVTIDRDFWNNSSALGREMVVFHELGHCALNQGHREAEDNNGSCLSIMNSGTSGCRVRYTNANRDFYLDELFEYRD